MPLIDKTGVSPSLQTGNICICNNSKTENFRFFYLICFSKFDKNIFQCYGYPSFSQARVEVSIKAWEKTE